MTHVTKAISYPHLNRLAWLRAFGIAAAIAAASAVVVAGPAPLGNSAPAASAATAHDPQFQNKTLWPNLTGKEAFVKQSWPKARVLVWAHPGTGSVPDPSQRKGRNPIHAMNAADWLENGKPASAPPDADTDVVFPDAATRYSVFPPAARHITIGRNATISVQAVTGNLWVKAGGKYGAVQGCLRTKGAQHTFIRNDNRPPAENASGREAKDAYNRLMFGHDLVVQKRKDASVEILGICRILDELVIWEGTAIVGPDSFLRPGNASCQVIGPDGALVLMSGAYFGKGGSGCNPIDIHVEGRIIAGTPERPLTKDATLGICSPGIDGEHHGLLVSPQGTLSSHSSDPAKARLVLKWGAGRSGGSPADERIYLTLVGKLDFNGVLFDNVAAGGIRLKDPAQRSQWKNVFFGPNNGGKPDQLFAKYEGTVPKAGAQGMGYIDKQPAAGAGQRGRP